MSAPTKTATVSFSIKGQVVIPSWLRKEFAIEKGTKAVVAATAEGILLKPVTSASIRRLRGILKTKSGAASLEQDRAELKQQERALEERRRGRNGTR